MALVEEIFIVHRVGDAEFVVTRYVDKTKMDAHTVRKHEDGSYTSDDIGFLTHGNAFANKRVKCVRRFEKTGERVHTFLRGRRV